MLHFHCHSGESLNINSIKFCRHPLKVSSQKISGKIFIQKHVNNLSKHPLINKSYILDISFLKHEIYYIKTFYRTLLSHLQINVLPVTDLVGDSRESTADLALSATDFRKFILEL